MLFIADKSGAFNGEGEKKYFKE